MKIKSIIITSVVALGLSVSAQANAQESAVERLMSSLISSAVSVTQAEISREVQQNIANAPYHVSLSDPPRSALYRDGHQRRNYLWQGRLPWL